VSVLVAALLARRDFLGGDPRPIMPAEFSVRRRQAMPRLREANIALVDQSGC